MKILSALIALAGWLQHGCRGAEVPSVLTSPVDWALSWRAKAHEPTEDVVQLYCSTRDLRSDRL